MADPRVKPCSVVLCIGEVDNYFQKKMEQFPEIQKVPKFEPCDEVTAPEKRSANQEFPPEAKRPCLDHSDDTSLQQDCIIKQEPQDEVNMNIENLVMPEFVSIKCEPFNETTISCETEFSSVLPETEQSCNQHVSDNSVVHPVQNLVSLPPVTTSTIYTVHDCDQLLPPLYPVASTSQIKSDLQIIKPKVINLKPKVAISNIDINPTAQTVSADLVPLVPQKIQDLQFLMRFTLPSKKSYLQGCHKALLGLDYARNYTSDQALSVLNEQNYCKQIKFAHKPDKIYYHCKHCFKNFSNHHDYFKHFISIHTLSFFCSSCNLKFTDLTLHILLKHNFLFCENVLEFYYSRRLHQYLELKSIDCLCCHMSLSNYGSLVEHIQSNHHVCRICSEHFKSNELLLTHIDQHSAGKVLYFKCNSCKLKLNSFPHMSKHVNTCCGGSILSTEIIMFPLSVVLLCFNCPYCPLSFVKEPVFFDHLLAHGKQSCRFCKKIFVPSDFMGNKVVKEDSCVTCNLKRNTCKVFQSANSSISLSLLSDKFNNSIKNLNESKTADLVFEITARKNPSKTLIKQEIVDLLKDIKFKFRTLDLENMKEIVRVNDLIVSTYPCLFCNDDQVQNIYDHFVDHVVVRLSCFICKCSTTNIQTFLVHLNETHEFHIKSFEYFKTLLGAEVYLKIYKEVCTALHCLFCNLDFVDVVDLLNHVTNTHLNCKYCGITSVDTKEYFEHNTKPQLKDFNNYQCLSCNTVTNCNVLAADHASRCHVLGAQSKTLSYEKCTKLCPSPLNLYFCPYCPKNFLDNINLLLHLNTHTGAQKCSQCERQFIPRLGNVDESLNGICLICFLVSKGLKWNETNKIGWIGAENFVEFDPACLEISQGLDPPDPVLSSVENKDP